MVPVTALSVGNYGVSDEIRARFRAVYKAAGARETLDFRKLAP